jgi:hypothetical protein
LVNRYLDEEIEDGEVGVLSRGTEVELEGAAGVSFKLSIGNPTAPPSVGETGKERKAGFGKSEWRVRCFVKVPGRSS